MTFIYCAGPYLNHGSGGGALGVPQHDPGLPLLLGAVLVGPHGTVGRVGGGHHARGCDTRKSKMRNSIEQGNIVKQNTTTQGR